MSQTTRKLSISDAELDALIEKESQKLRYDELLDTDLTAQRLVEMKGLTLVSARRVLRNLVKSGIMRELRIKNADGGGVIKGYRKV